MTRFDIALLAVLFLLYGYQCLYWISPGEEGYSRLRHGWKPHVPAQSFFSIGGHLLVISDPFMLRPGFLRIRPSTMSPELNAYALRRVAASIRKLWFARQLCRVQALLLLVVLPYFILHNLFSWIGWIFCIVLLFSHSLILLALSQELPRTRRVSWFSVAAPLLFNPFRAIRLIDTVADLRFRDVMRYAEERGARNLPAEP